MNVAELKKKCPNQNANQEFCNCSYTGCEKAGLCCECIRYHRDNNQLPACFFTDEAERTYNRSFRKFMQTWS